MLIQTFYFCFRYHSRGPAGFFCDTATSLTHQLHTLPATNSRKYVFQNPLSRYCSKERARNKYKSSRITNTGISASFQFCSGQMTLPNCFSKKKYAIEALHYSNLLMNPCHIRHVPHCQLVKLREVRFLQCAVMIDIDLCKSIHVNWKSISSAILTVNLVVTSRGLWQLSKIPFHSL